MARLEDLKAGAYIQGLTPGGTAKLINLAWFGDQAVKATYEDAQGKVSHRLVFRNEEPTLTLVTAGRPWSFDGDGHGLRLASEAYRIRLAYLFDPYLAIHTSQIEPLPHQITAVYGEMLPCQPLRFLLADDPGAGKTIMAGLLIKELLIRGDLERCLVVAPGSLVEQWQDELSQKFGLAFDILTRDLDYRPITEMERAAVTAHLEAPWLAEDIENRVLGYAIETLVQQHLDEVRTRRLPQIDKVQTEVEARLKREINYWDRRAEDLKAQERAGKQTRLSSVNAAARADELAERLQRRLAGLDQERQISALPPRIRGGAIVVPAGLLRRLVMPQGVNATLNTAAGRAEIERLAMAAVMNAERSLGFEPRDVSVERIGYDIESRDPESGRLRFIEVKGRIEGADTVTVTRNEILAALNKPEALILAIVQVASGAASEPRYLREPFTREPDFGATSVNYDLVELLARATSPA